MLKLLFSFCLSKRVFINPFYKPLVSLANISTSSTSLLDFQNNTCRQSTTGPYSSGNPVCWYIRQCISSASVCKLVCEEPLFSFFRVCTRLGTKTTIWKKKPQNKTKKKAIVWLFQINFVENRHFVLGFFVIKWKKATYSSRRVQTMTELFP